MPSGTLFMSRRRARGTKRPRHYTALDLRASWRLSRTLRGNTYRAVYTVRFSAAVFVLHVYQKKAVRGIATPRQDMELIRERLKVAEQMAKELAG